MQKQTTCLIIKTSTSQWMMKQQPKTYLVEIQAANENFSFPKQKLIMKINGLVVEAKQSIASIVEKLGTSLQIDPVNSYRSNDGLKINDDDFMQSYDTFGALCNRSRLKVLQNIVCPALCV